MEAKMRQERSTRVESEWDGKIVRQYVGETSVGDSRPTYADRQERTPYYPSQRPRSYYIGRPHYYHSRGELSWWLFLYVAGIFTGIAATIRFVRPFCP